MLSAKILVIWSWSYYVEFYGLANHYSRKTKILKNLKKIVLSLIKQNLGNPQDKFREIIKTENKP